MNAMSNIPDGVLVSDRFLASNDLRGGDTLTFNGELWRADLLRSRRKLWACLIISPLGILTEDLPLVVGNLTHLFEQAGSEFPFRVWIKMNGSLR